MKKFIICYPLFSLIWTLEITALHAVISIQAGRRVPQRRIETPANSMTACLGNPWHKKDRAPAWRPIVADCNRPRFPAFWAPPKDTLQKVLSALFPGLPMCFCRISF
jgi:hypothetical protein